jgi:type II secretory pathway predicted ATPase ExeA/transcriptional regulator with XRE-family HTH domain
LTSRILLRTKRKVVSINRDEPGSAFHERLAALKERHNLSLRDLAHLCGDAANGVSKTAMARLLHGELTVESLEAIRPKLLSGLRALFVKRKMAEADLEAELSTLLDDDQPFSLTDEEKAMMPAWTQRLDVFRIHYALSFNRLASICGGSDVGINDSTLHRRCADPTVEPRSTRRIKPLVISGLRRFLASRGRTPQQIETELAHIFQLEEVAMIAPRTTLPLEACKHFGLKHDPFDPNDPRDIKDAFTTPQFDKALAQIADAINYQGFIGISGEIGSGKTILKRRAVEMAAQSKGRFRLLWPEFFNMDRVHSGSIASYLLRAFGQTAPLDVVARAERLKQILNDASESGTRVAIGFDECHHLDDKLLTALKNFWELGTGGYTRFLGLVLFGQPKFEDKLRDAKFREILERIEIVQMPKLTKAAGDYLAHRVRIAGGDIAKLFEPDAVRLLTKQAATPLALGNLANAALLKAYQFGEKKVVATLVTKQDSEPAVYGVRRSS